MIGTILLSCLILYTIWAAFIKLVGGPITTITNQGSDLVLYVVWIGYGIKHLFW